MIAEPALLRKPAEEALISVPPDLEKYDPEQYPHWDVFCIMQLGTPLPDWSAHFHNAEVIARIADDEIYHITRDDILKRGFKIGFTWEEDRKKRNRIIAGLLIAVLLFIVLFTLI